MLVQDYLTWEIHINTPSSAIEALEISDRYHISYWDALVIHAAESCQAGILYSEDLAADQQYGTVRVLNPLDPRFTI